MRGTPNRGSEGGFLGSRAVSCYPESVASVRGAGAAVHRRESLCKTFRPLQTAIFPLLAAQAAQLWRDSEVSERPTREFRTTFMILALFSTTQ